LFIVGKQLDKHPDANGWRKRATERFVQNVTTTVSTTDGVHLEHSIGYHMFISELLDKLINEFGFAHDELGGLHSKMVAAAPWFVMPDGRYPQFGDTNLSRAPQWVMDIEDQHTGFNAFLDAGAAVYRDDSSYFMTATWYHSRAHKHADETSFVWAENGRRLIVDTGGYGYFYEEPGRIYAESSQAHNSLTLDTPFGWRNNKPYGSGVLDTVSEGGWHAVLAKNPLLARQSVDHRRMFAYLPGQFLIVIDQLNASVCPVSTRRFHFAPKLEVVEQDGGSVRLADDRDSVWLQTGARPREMRAVRGQKLPSVQGFTFPSQRNWVPSTAIEAEDRVCGEPMVVALSVGETKPAFEVSGERDGARIVIGDKQLRLQYGANLLALTVE